MLKIGVKILDVIKERKLRCSRPTAGVHGSYIWHHELRPAEGLPRAAAVKEWLTASTIGCQVRDNIRARYKQAAIRG